jgi:radical SAM superfamily enzyme
MSQFGYLPIGTYLKNKFGTRVIKLALDGGFTCPNRDGTKSVGLGFLQ